MPHHHRRQEFHDGNGHLLQAGGLEQQDGRNPHRQRENNRLQEFRKSVELAYEDSLKKQNVVSAELLKNTLAKRAVIPTKLLQMGERERERLLARSKEINSTSTYRHSGYYQKYLKEYLTSLGKEDIEFTDITEDFGSSYKAFMKRNKNFSAQQINKCLCWLSKLVYLAVDYEILRANPLEDMEIREEARTEAQAHQPCGIENHPRNTHA